MSNRRSSKRRDRCLELSGHVAAQIDIIGMQRHHRGSRLEVELFQIDPDDIRCRGQFEIIAPIRQIADGSVLRVKCGPVDRRPERNRYISDQTEHAGHSRAPSSASSEQKENKWRVENGRAD